MEKKTILELAPPTLVLLDAFYFILKPRNFFSSDQGKLFGTQMYEKSSFFFSVVNGVNYTLEISILAFVFWFIIPTINHKGSLIIPPFTLSFVWTAERFRDSFLTSVLGTYFAFLLYIGARIFLQKVSFREYEHSILRYCVVGSVQALMMTVGFYIINWIGYVD